MIRVTAALAALLALSCSSKTEVKGGGSGTTPDPVKPGPPTFTLFALAEMRGQIGPCGCTSDPLGDLSRTAKVIEDARAKGPVVTVDAGSLLYSKAPIPSHLAFQEDAKAKVLIDAYAKSLKLDAVGLGPMDVARPGGEIQPARQAANVTSEVAASSKVTLEAPKLVAVGGAQVGVFGVLAEGAVAGLTIGDPIEAARTAIAELRAKKAQVIVALVQAASKKDAVALVKAIGPGIDVAIAGLGAVAPEPTEVESAQQVGDAWLVVPANRGQVLARIDITLRGDKVAPLVDALGPGMAETRKKIVDRQLLELDADIAKFVADPTSDAKFVAQKKAERAALAAERAQLDKQPYKLPATGSYFTLDHLRINKALACDAGVQDRVTGYYRATGEANVAAFKTKPVSAPAKGEAKYVGMAVCDDCHPDEVKHWKTTKHAGAWKTLVDRGQEFDFDCIGCHVTGYDKPGGANLGFNEPLRDVQCETCHGPGSLHVDLGGTEKPAKIARKPADDLCATQCHTKEHSDTFDLAPYLRDIVGEGHAPKFRATLGDGPTGHSLRSAALDKAGRTLGAGCTR